MAKGRNSLPYPVGPSFSKKTPDPFSPDPFLSRRLNRPATQQYPAQRALGQPDKYVRYEGDRADERHGKENRRRDPPQCRPWCPLHPFHREDHHPDDRSTGYDQPRHRDCSAPDQGSEPAGSAAQTRRKPHAAVVLPINADTIFAIGTGGPPVFSRTISSAAPSRPASQPVARPLAHLSRRSKCRRAISSSCSTAAYWPHAGQRTGLPDSPRRLQSHAGQYTLRSSGCRDSRAGWDSVATARS